MSMRAYDSQPPDDSPLSGSNAMLQASMFVSQNVSGVVGDAFSWLTEYSAMLTSALSIPQCSFSATSDSLGNKDVYGTFFRTVSASTEQGQMMASYIQLMGWRRVSVLYADDSYGRTLARTIITNAAHFNLRILKAETIHPQGSGHENISNVLDRIQAAGSYINVILATDVLIFETLDMIHQKGMFGAPYVWIVVNNVFIDLQLVFDDISFDGLIMFDPHYVVQDATFHNFQNRWRRLDPAVYPGAGPNTSVVDFDIHAYSCAWMIALSYQKDIENARARGTNESVIIEELLYGSYPRTIANFSADLFSTVTYSGPAGRIQLNKLGNSINAPSLFFQIQQGSQVLVATTDSTPDGSMRPAQIAGAHVWPGFNGQYPEDAPAWARLNFTWEDGAGQLMGILAAIGGFSCLILILIVAWQYRHPVIRAASAPLCILEVTGAIIVYGTIVLKIGDYSNAICIATPLLFCFGFSLLLGSLVVKLLRQYRLQNNRLQDQHAIRDRALLVYLAVFVALFMIPSVIFVALTLPQVRYVGIGSDREAFACVRTSRLATETGIIVLGTIWALPLIVIPAACIFISFRICDVPTRWNESNHIRYTMYNFLFYFPIYVTSSFVETLHFRVTLMVENIVTFFSVTASMLILFGPKLVYMWRLHKARSVSRDGKSLESPLSHTSSSEPSTQEEQRKIEKMMRRHGFYSTGRRPVVRRRKGASQPILPQSSIDPQVFFMMEPTPQGPIPYQSITGSLDGPYIQTNEGDHDMAVTAGPARTLRSESQDLNVNYLEQLNDNDDDDGDDDDAGTDRPIPVLMESKSWFKSALRQWRPMRVVAVPNLSMVIMSDDVKTRITTCLYHSVRKVTEVGHYYLRIHCVGDEHTFLLEFNCESARDRWQRAFTTPFTKASFPRTDITFNTTTTSTGAERPRADSYSMPRLVEEEEVEDDENSRNLDNISIPSLSKEQLVELYQDLHQHPSGPNIINDIHSQTHSPSNVTS
ncbi:hypothetical protein BG004_007772 [Podila humilis]|nr:hypothetical protein BG004_007772 [Podila humilis]